MCIKFDSKNVTNVKLMVTLEESQQIIKVM